MTSTDSSSAPSDLPPKRFIKRLGLAGRKQALYIVIPLLFINAGIIRTVIDQVSIRASAESLTQIKDETTTITSADAVTNDTAPEVAIPQDETPVITTYIVRSGDTLSGIADKFNISINTIRWANDLTSKSAIKPGDDLVILPVTGVEYTVKKGDTLSGIAAKFDADQSEILKFNDIEASSIKVGTELIIPEAEPLAEKAPVKAVAKVVAKEKVVEKTSAKIASTETKTDDEDKPKSKVKFTNPIPGAVLTQRVHDGNAVDFGAPVGTTVVAAAAGKVIVAKASGYNGGYGTMIVINHPDGSQTQYSHLSKIFVAAGDSVSQGEKIALSGNTGRSTGPHLHYNERNTGSKNTFANLPLH